jgi:hypothetical protein
MLPQLHADTLLEWQFNGSVGPMPHALKMLHVIYYVRRTGAKTLVETGTLRGETAEAVARACPDVQVITIENSRECYDQSMERLKAYPNVRQILADSSEIMASLLPTLRTPVVFWLDAHYSGGITVRNNDGKTTAVNGELNALINAWRPDYTILIDDARHFGAPTHGHYPHIDNLEAMAKEKFPGTAFSVHNDIIRIIPERYAKYGKNFDRLKVAE